MKIEVTKEQNSFGKYTGKFIAKFGKWEEKGDTKEEAKESLLQAMEWYQSEVDFSPKYRWVNDDTVLILNRNFYGFTVETLHKGSNYAKGSTIYGRMSVHQASKTLEQHADGYKAALPVI